MTTATFHPFRLCQIGNRSGDPITREQAVALLGEAWPDMPGFWRIDELHCLATGAEAALTLRGGKWLENNE